MSNPLIPPGEPIDVYVPYDDRPLLREADLRTSPHRRVKLPLILFLLTCASTFFAGATDWFPAQYLQIPGGVQLAIERNWQQGLIYMVAVIGILLTHEMGHFLQAVRYHIPASLPFFIPLPIMMTGTMGAVIGMEGSRADRKQLFDIGISGPLAGLVVAVPIVIWGILTGEAAPPRQMAPNGWHINDPLIIKLLIHWLRPEIPFGGEMMLNPLLMAGWVGMLITGLDMMPVSQLDGGHVIYGLFGPRARIVARLFIVGVIAAMLYFDSYNWIVMLGLVLFIGIDHPPTRDDTVKLGPMRTAIGWLSLLIPFFCFTPVIM